MRFHQMLAAAALLGCLIQDAHAQGKGREGSPAVVSPVVASPLRQAISLDGTWDFATDPNQIGEAQKWFEPATALPGKQSIQVPGCWEAQGIGGPGLSPTVTPERSARPLRGSYVGAAWYRKEVKIPMGWKDKRIWLKVGGVNAQGWFYVNGGFVGHLQTHGGSFKFNVTDLVRPGEPALVVARVRNDMESHLGLANTFGTFGGLYRGIELEATPAVMIDDVWVEPAFDAQTARVHVVLRRDGANPPGELKLAVKTQTWEQPAQPSGEAAAEVRLADQAPTTELVLPIKLDPFRPWSPDSPALYQAQVVLSSAGRPIHGWAERFGIRKWETRGQRFFLNNRPFYLRGFGDDYVYPVNLCSPADVDAHRKHMKLARKYGFNYVRLHTHTENPEYFAAADEVGIMVQPEYFGYGYNLMHYTPQQVEDTRQAMVEYFTLLRRHVSFSTYCLGNESWIAPPHDREIFQSIKKMDPTRLVLHNDGGNCLPDNSDFATSWGDKDFNRPWAFSYMEYNLNDKNSGYCETLPHVLHEFINAVVEYDPRLSERYTGGHKPPNTAAEFKAKLDEFGLSEQWGMRVQQAGERMMGDVQKRGIESARRIPWLDGYCYWTIVDVIHYACQGLFNAFWEPKQSTAEFFNQFNGPTAIVVRGLPARPVRGQSAGPAANPAWAGTFVIAGQSNASGHRASLAEKEAPDPRVTMFGNDYRWKQACEPIDDATGQLDEVSSDQAYVNDKVGHSFALKAAKELAGAGVKAVRLIPCAKGGSSIAQWRRGADPLDRFTLFGSLNARVKQASPEGVTAVWWHQGESEVSHDLTQYIGDQAALVGEFRGVMGERLPIIYAQLAKIGLGQPPASHRIMEAQRRLETGSGYDCELPRYHMVVTFDLPLAADALHLTAESQKELGRRFALATRQHVYGEKIDGAGPRLVALYHNAGANDQVKVVFNQPINAGERNYDDQFRAYQTNQIAAWNDQPWLQKTMKMDAAGLKALTIVSAVRDPNDDHAVRLTMSEKPTGLVLVSYGSVTLAATNQWLRGVIKGANDLPAPAFGLLEVGAELGARPGDALHVQWVISHFGNEPLRESLLEWKLVAADHTLAAGHSEMLAIEAGQCVEAARSIIELPTVARPTSAKLIVEIPGTTIRNEWPLWLMPESESVPSRNFTNVAATESMLRKLAPHGPGFQAWDPKAADAIALLVTDNAGSARQALEQGKRVLWLNRSPALTPEATFRLGWWIKSRQSGTALARHLAFGDFPHDGYLSPLFYRLINRSEPLTPAFRDVEKLMVGTGNAGYQLYAWQAKVGQGRLLSTTLDLLGGTPEGSSLLDEMIAYARSERFQPQGSFDLEKVRAGMEEADRFAKSMNGWSQTLRAVEKQPYNSFMGVTDMAIVRLNSGDRSLDWRTQPVPRELDPAKDFTFKWAAGM